MSNATEISKVNQPFSKTTKKTQASIWLVRENQKYFIWQQDYNGSQETSQQFHSVISICKAVPSMSMLGINISELRTCTLDTRQKQIQNHAILCKFNWELFRHFWQSQHQGSPSCICFFWKQMWTIQSAMFSSSQYSLLFILVSSLWSQWTLEN